MFRLIIYFSKNRCTKGAYMDKQIKKIQKMEKKEAKALSSLAKEDKKRDKACDYGKKMMKKK